jgi:uncharacterized membrane protein
MVLAHTLTEWAEYSRCSTCQAWSGSSSVLWVIMVIVVDICIIILVLALYRIWQQSCTPCFQEVQRRRVGVAQTLNATLFTNAEQLEQQDHTLQQEDVRAEDEVGQSGVINGEICSHVTVVVGHDGAEISASEAGAGELQMPASIYSAADAVDGFVEDVV